MMIPIEKSEMTSTLKGLPFVCSWSGGKDSCLALWHAIELGGVPKLLLTMLDERGQRSRSHGLPPQVLQAQADSLGIPLQTACASWDDYEAVFVQALTEAAKDGIQAGVFGDIDFEENRAWEENVSQRAGLRAYLPLWQQPRQALLKTFLRLGFKATVVVTKDERLGKRFLGRGLDAALLTEFQRAGIDLAGEAGEYHSLVTDGPLFSEPLRLQKGNVTSHSGSWFLDIQVRD